MTESKTTDTLVYANGETISCDVYYESDDIAINCDEAPDAQPPGKRIGPTEFEAAKRD